MEWIKSKNAQPDGRPILVNIKGKIHIAYWKKAVFEQYEVGCNNRCHMCDGHTGIGFDPNDSHREYAREWKYLDLPK